MNIIKRIVTQTHIILYKHQFVIMYFNKALTMQQSHLTVKSKTAISLYIDNLARFHI